MQKNKECEPNEKQAIPFFSCNGSLLALSPELLLRNRFWQSNRIQQLFLLRTAGSPR